MHVSAAGQETFTFELLHDKYMKQVHLTASAPVNSERGEINMPFMSRNVLLGVRCYYRSHAVYFFRDH